MLSKLVMASHHGKRKPSKRSNNSVHLSLVLDLLSQPIFKKPRTKTPRSVSKEYFPTSSIHHEFDANLRSMEKEDGTTSKKGQVVLISPSSSFLPNQPLSEITVPGPISNLDDLMFDKSIILDFFKDIPDFEY